MGYSKISHVLLDLGFFSALGTTEHAGPRPQVLVVKRQTPFTYDYNNGVMVVYDEEGRPWIRSGEVSIYEMVTELRNERRDNPLTRGAYVPHSNDGGHFVREILPELQPKAIVG